MLDAAAGKLVITVPCGYVAGDVEDCLIQPISQGQFTPLPEALCWVVLDLTASGQVAVLETIRAALHVAFPEMERPSKDLVYDTLAKLMADRKVSYWLLLQPDYVILWRNNVFFTSSSR